MPSSTILSDNGVSSGTSGIKTSGGNDGLLLLQTTTAGGTATTAVTIGTDQSVTFAQGANLPNTFGFKNRIINGAQIIDQRNSSTSAVTVNSVTKAYATDRFCGTGIGSAGVFTLAQVTTAPSNYINSLKANVTTADASLAATDLYRIMHLIEGSNCADLGWGTATAKTVTLSFYVYSNLTGTFGGSITNSAANRSYPFSYTISAASTWEQKTITIPGDTSGTWLTTTGIGISINWGLGVGSTYNGTANAWAGAEYYSVTGATNVMGTLSNTFFITGVQLEAGSTATSFDFRSYDTELRMCRRYYEVLGWPSAAGTAMTIGSYSGSPGGSAGAWYFKAAKRASPTITFNAAGNCTSQSANQDMTNCWNGTVPSYLNIATGSSASAEL